MPITFILNAPVMPSFGSYSFTGPLLPEEARAVITDGFTSAVGHAGAAEFLTALLGVEILVNRIAIEMQPGDRALVLRLKERLPENRSLTAEETLHVGYELGLLTRAPTDFPSPVARSENVPSQATELPLAHEAPGMSNAVNAEGVPANFWQTCKAIAERSVPPMRHALFPVLVLVLAVYACVYVWFHDSFGEWANWITLLSASLGATSAFSLLLREHEDRKRREEQIAIKLRYAGRDIEIPHPSRRGSLSRAELQGILGLYYGVGGRNYPQALISHIFRDGTFEKVVRPEKPESELVIELDTADPSTARDAFNEFEKGVASSIQQAHRAR